VLELTVKSNTLDLDLVSIEFARLRSTPLNSKVDLVLPEVQRSST
jgi:hypothetical protein